MGVAHRQDDQIDITNTNPEYWKGILSERNLGENRGRTNRWLVYGHDYRQPPDNIEKCGGGRRISKRKTLNQIEKDRI